jgi:site-specific recombinase XerD
MPGSPLLERFSREYQAYHQISPERARQQRRLLEEFEQALDGRGLHEAGQGDLQAFAGGLLERGYHVNTVRKKLNMIRPFYSWAYAVGAISADQFLGLKSVRNPRGSTARSLPRPYTKDELREFWLALEESLPLLPERGKGSLAIRRWLQGKGRWRRVWRHAMRLQVEAIIALALDCGLRRGEIYRLSVNDLHYDNEYIVVTGAAKGRDGQPRVRTVPFTEVTRETCKAWLEFRAWIAPKHDRPWLSLYGSRTYTHPMSDKRFAELLSKLLGQRADAEDEFWELHRFRHTCGTSWLRAGVPLEVVSRLLGHSSLQQTLGYAEILKSDIAKHLAQREVDFAKLTQRPERKAA